MVKELQYTNIRRVLDNLLDHPLLRDLTLEQVVRHAIRFMSLHGYPRLYQDKIEEVPISSFRGTLPCDLVSINQVKDMKTGVCLRSMTDNFPKALTEQEKHQPCVDPQNNMRHMKDLYIPPAHRYIEEPAFKTQGRIIYTSFPEGMVEISYKAVPIDDDGFPLLVDNENYLGALEAYIKKQVFTIKFDTGDISAGVLHQAKQDYAFLAGELAAEFMIPSVSEAETMTRIYNTLIPRVRQFDNGFRHLGDREYLRRH